MCRKYIYIYNAVAVMSTNLPAAPSYNSRVVKCSSSTSSNSSSSSSGSNSSSCSSSSSIFI